MKIDVYECVNCFKHQAVKTIEMFGGGDDQVKRMRREIEKLERKIEEYETPPELGLAVHSAIKDILGVPDPYRSLKKKHIDSALQIYPQLKQMAGESQFPLLTAARLSAAGNIIDLAVNSQEDVSEAIEKIKEIDFTVNDFSRFMEEIEGSELVLMIGDNAGETVFDTLLLEQLGSRKLVYAVRENPIINDATSTEAVESGIDKFADIISSGCSAPGTVLSMCSEEFLSVFNEADVVISKGQGNFEALDSSPRPVYFILKAKCDVVASNIGCKIGDSIFKMVS